MPVLIEDLVNNKLYRKSVYLPSDANNKKKSSVVFLMTPSYKSSVKEMNLPYFLNNRRFESYYTEKDISFVLSEDHRLLQNSEDITIMENTISKFTRITITDKDDLDVYGISYDNTLSDSFVAHVYVDHNKEYYGCLIIDNTGTLLYKVDSYSFQIKKDLIDYAIIHYDVIGAKIWSKEDETLFKKFKFVIPSKKIVASNILYRGDPVKRLNEAGSFSKIDLEIKVWEAQIAISQMIIKNFNDANWMKHMYKTLKNKINNIPLDDFVEDIDGTINSWKRKLSDQKATLSFYMAVKELELKETLDLSDIVNEYIDWVEKLSCPKALKLKIINNIISSYNITIRECEFNLKRYRALDEGKKRLENTVALGTKIFSAFSFLTASGPLQIVRGMVFNSILPKSRKKNVLSETELEAKIEMYTKIVEVLEEKKKEIQSLEESWFINRVATISESYDIPFCIITEKKKYVKQSGESKDLVKARQFVADVKDLADAYKLPVFVITNGASGYSNNGCDAVKQARDSHMEWEKSHGADPYEDWSNNIKHETVILELSSIEDTLKNIDGYISHKQVRNNIFLVKRNKLYSDDHKNHEEDWLYILTSDNKIAGEMLLLVKEKEMYSIETKKKYRNHGYATQLLTCAVNDLNANFLSIHIADENGPAHKLYLKLGFKEYERGKDFIYFKIHQKITEKQFTQESVLYEAGNPAYSYPYDRKEIINNYGKDIYNKLMKDPAHAFRADTGIELIHQEPSKEELKRIMKNWERMSDTNKKKSDEMSIKLFGKDNRSHYKELLSLYENTELEPIKESILFSKTNLYLNFDKFENGKLNICFVTGLSGSGKSTLSTQLASKYSAEVIELDIFECCGGYSEDNIKEAGQVFYDYLSKNKDLWDRLANHKIHGQELRDEISKFIKYVISWCSDHKNNKYIIEGVQVYSLMEISQIKGKPLVIVNASMLKSIAQRMKRGWQNRNDEDSDWKKQLAEFPQMIRYYIDGEKTFNDFKRELLKEDIDTLLDDVSPVHEEYRVSYLNEAVSITDRYLLLEDRMIFLNAEIESLQEGDSVYNATLRRILYNERIRTQKEVFVLYDQVKADCPFIKYTYPKYDKYMNRNLFIDWSFYTETFFKNNFKTLDKAVDLYIEFANRFIDDNRLGDYNRKTIFIPVDDWIPGKNLEMIDYKVSINPISIIYRLVKRGDINMLRSSFGKYDIVFTTATSYMKMNFSNFESKDLPRFMNNIKAMINKEQVIDNTEPDNSVGGIVNQVIDRLEDSDTIQINNLTGATKSTPGDIVKKINDAELSSDKPEGDTEEQVVNAITKVAATSGSAEEVMDKLDQDEDMKRLLVDLKNQSPQSVNITPTRAARIRDLNNKFTAKQITNSTVGELISKKEMPIPETALPVDSINEEWSHMTFMNHAKSYDLTSDILSCLHYFANTTEPFAVRDFDIQNTSTSEDWVDTWTVSCEDGRGKRFTLKFDIPRLKNYRAMHLRGNDKTINGQLMNLPILKTEANTCQMTSNYNKIFFSGYGTSTGKSFVVADRIIKALNKKDDIKGVITQHGDNSRISSKYDLPSDYIDLSSSFSKITVINKHVTAKYTFFFNQDEIREKYKDIIKDSEGLPVGILEADKSSSKIIYYNSETPFSWELLDTLQNSEGFSEVYNTTNTSVRYTYSKASILDTDIPLAVIIGYYIGLLPMLDRVGIKYQVSDKRPKYDKNIQDIIKLSDAYILYDLDYDSSMLMNGLKDTDIAAYSLAETGNRRMWIEFMDNFGGRLKADGLDMFYDLMMDPITIRICKTYEIPTDFIDGLIYVNMLLSDNKYNRHTDITGNRYRSIEILAGYTYKAICNSYTQYRRDLRAGRDAKMTMKQTAIIDLIFADNTFGDLSSLTDLLEAESLATTSFKGLSGMNSDRAYGLDKRTFDESMVNKLALSTGFAANAGINRVSTIDMDIDTSRGYIKNTNPDDMSITKTFSMAEALTPFGTTSDDPFRSAMTYIQTSKHGMRVKTSDPLLVVNGAEEALPYMTSDTFTYKSKQAGKVIEKTDEYMVLQYKDSTTEVVDLREKILKNSDGGMYIAVKLDTDLKKGNLFSSQEIVAVDRTSYSKAAGLSNNISYNIGTFVKFAVINSDEGFEDSCVETRWLAEAMSSTVVINKEYTLPKDTNVYLIAKKGQPIQEGEPLLIFQNAFDEEDANMLIKTLSEEDGEDIIAELGRIPIKSKITGVVKDIKITRTVDKEELSPSLLKIVNAYEKEVKQFNKILDQYDKDKALIADATYKLEPTGKLKNARDSIRIEFSLAYEDKFGIGDKTVCYSALKGVSKGVISAGLEPSSSYRPEEKIHYIQSTNGDMKRMVGSILKVGALNKVMVELGRNVCDIMGVKWKYFDEY